MSEQEIELAALFPQGKELTIGEDQRTITIKPFKFGQLGKVMKTIQPISDSLALAFHSDRGQAAAIVDLLANSGDEMLELVVLGTSLPKDYVEQLSMDDALEAVLAVVQVNADFFVRKVLPVIKGNIASMVPSAGQTQ